MPTLFVSWSFININNSQSTGNCILAHVRHGPSRTRENYSDLCASIEYAWNGILRGNYPDGSKIPSTLTIFILGDILAGHEAGMAMPPAGQEREWLKRNVGMFRLKALDGEERFEGLMKELKERPDFKGILS